MCTGDRVFDKQAALLLGLGLVAVPAVVVWITAQPADPPVPDYPMVEVRKLIRACGVGPAADVSITCTNPIGDRFVCAFTLPSGAPQLVECGPHSCKLSTPGEDARP